MEFNLMVVYSWNPKSWVEAYMLAKPFTPAGEKTLEGYKGDVVLRKINDLSTSQTVFYKKFF